MSELKILILLTFLSLSVFVQAQKFDEVQLANEYFTKGEKEKALTMYEDLSRQMVNIPLIHNNYFHLLLEMEKYDDAQKYLRGLTKRFPNNIYYKLDEGLVYKSQGNEEKADKHFRQIINDIKNDNYLVQSVSNYFVNKQFTSLAAETLQQARKSMHNENLYALELANVYRLANEKDKMVEEYLKYVTQNPANLSYVKNTLQNLLSDPEELESLENILYKKIQDEPDSQIYGELLIWVNLQQKNFYGAFIQARAIDKRMKAEGSRSMNIGNIALDNNDYETAIKIFSYIIKTYPNTYNYLLARMYLIKAYEKKVKNTYPVDKEEIKILIKDYDIFVREMGINRNTLEALRNKALLHAFYLNQKDSAISILKSVIENPKATSELRSQSKLDLGDIYILTGEYWESTLLYSQVEKSNKNEPLGYEAKLKNAKLSYYKGNFQLAQEHLDILKQATTREIANDAMALSILIKDNVGLDTTETAMKKYAAIELMLYQNQIDSALLAIKQLRKEFNRHSLSDELLWLEADIYKKMGDFEESIRLLKKIFNEYDYDILSDDAYFTIGDIYERQLNDKEKAMEVYRDFLTRYPGSVYVAEARKRYRQLRGDFNM
ncbi:tetratricopeptide repeat protein [Fulvivirga sediminis]|uniref:Tetratricopeptide repeat protein n=1 Tax=Fulvivirga sediminis TaxID=2803949 RepID=A0A937JXE2_9BACT|nr:tetratricopeptide repeat protein [Fulvivirga sediminis]MBL3654534.1 tetratricopeptide repeat protein [Fulvivirga sediminis]